MTEAHWKQRYLAPTIDQVVWAAQSPDRLGVISTEDGSYQAWGWNLASGERRRVSAGGVGAEEVHVLPDGSGAVWWLDAYGDERGRWMATPFEGGDPRPLVADVPDGWMSGISFESGNIAIGLATEEDYRVYVSLRGETTREIFRGTQPAGVGREWPQGVGGLSPDGALVCVRHTEHGDLAHNALRLVDTRTDWPVADLIDDHMTLTPGAWSADSGRFAFEQEITGIERPGIWERSTGERTDLGFADLPGPINVLGWSPDGRLLLRHEHAGRMQLLLADAAGNRETLLDVEGTITQAGFRADGELWYGIESSTEPRRFRSLAGRDVVALPGDPPARGRPFRPIEWTNPKGDTIHGFVVKPDGEPPFPTIVSVHGGPEAHHTDAFDPRRQAYADEGFAVLLVNYRGSSGRGRDFRDALQGNIGFPESEDIVAGLDHLIAEGVADPARVFLEGWSWGGYLTTLNAGINPDRWRAVCAGIPVGDYVAAHYECAPLLRAWDLATLGGSPTDLPDLYHERNPMTYVDRVTAPMLLIAGENDSRCPIGQVITYYVTLKARGHDVQLHTYASGHHANDVDERIRQVEMVVNFFRRYL